MAPVRHRAARPLYGTGPLGTCMASSHSAPVWHRAARHGYGTEPLGACTAPCRSAPVWHRAGCHLSTVRSRSAYLYGTKLLGACIRYRAAWHLYGTEPLGICIRYLDPGDFNGKQVFKIVKGLEHVNYKNFFVLDKNISNLGLHDGKYGRFISNCFVRSNNEAFKRTIAYCEQTLFTVRNRKM